MASDLAPPTPRAARWLVVAWGVLAVIGLLLRWHRLTVPLDTDEFYTLIPMTLWEWDNVWAEWWSEESSVNPPFWRVLLSVVADGHTRATAGRLISLGCGVASLPVVGLLAWRASGGSALASLVATALLVVHPMHIDVSGMTRAYAATVLVVLLHLLAVADLMERNPRHGRTSVLAGITATAVPCLHYGAVGPLAVVGALVAARIGWRRAARIYAGPVVVLLSLAGPLFLWRQHLGSHVGRPTPIEIAAFTAGGGMTPLRAARSVFVALHLYRSTAYLVVPTLALCITTFSILSDPKAQHAAARVTAAWTASAAVSIAMLSALHLVREPLAVYVGLGLGTTWLGWGFARTGWGRRALAIAVALFYSWDYPSRIQRLYAEHDTLRAPLDVLASAPTWEERRAGRTIYVAPGFMLVPMRWEVTGQLRMPPPEAEACGGPKDICMSEGGRTWLRLPDDPSQPVPDGLIVWINPTYTPRPPEACEVFADEGMWEVWDCHPPARTTPPNAGDD